MIVSRVTLSIACVLQFTIGCGTARDQGGGSSDVKTNPVPVDPVNPDPLLSYADWPKSFVDPAAFDGSLGELKAIDSLATLRNVHTLNAVYANVPQRNPSKESIDPSEKNCQDEKLRKALVRADGSRLVIDATVDLSECMGTPQSPSVRRFVARYYLWLVCPSDDLSAFNGKSILDVVPEHDFILGGFTDNLPLAAPMTPAISLCPKSEVFVIAQTSSLEQARPTGPDGTRQERATSESGILRSGTEGCVMTRNGNGFGTKGACTRFRHLLAESPNDAGTSERSAYLERLDATSDLHAAMGARYFDEGGALKVRLNDWTGTMSYHGANTAPDVELTRGTETFKEAFRGNPVGRYIGAVPDASVPVVSRHLFKIPGGNGVNPCPSGAPNGAVNMNETGPLSSGCLFLRDYHFLFPLGGDEAWIGAVELQEPGLGDDTGNAQFAVALRVFSDSVQAACYASFAPPDTYATSRHTRSDLVENIDLCGTGLGEHAAGVFLPSTTKFDEVFVTTPEGKSFRVPLQLLKSLPDPPAPPDGSWVFDPKSNREICGATSPSTSAGPLELKIGVPLLGPGASDVVGRAIVGIDGVGAVAGSLQCFIAMPDAIEDFAIDPVSDALYATFTTPGDAAVTGICKLDPAAGTCGETYVAPGLTRYTRIAVDNKRSRLVLVNLTSIDQIDLATKTLSRVSDRSLHVDGVVYDGETDHLLLIRGRDGPEPVLASLDEKGVDVSTLKLDVSTLGASALLAFRAGATELRLSKTKLFTVSHDRLSEKISVFEIDRTTGRVSRFAPNNE